MARRSPAIMDEERRRNAARCRANLAIRGARYRCPVAEHIAATWGRPDSVTRLLVDAGYDVRRALDRIASFDLPMQRLALLRLLHGKPWATLDELERSGDGATT